MIDVNFRDFQKLFFDRAKVIRAMNSATRQALSKAGAFIRTRARTSMRRKKGASVPGTPPHAHKGLLKKFLYFGYEPNTQSVVVGPIRLGKGEAPPLNEFGGTAVRLKTVTNVSRRVTPAQAKAFRTKIKTGQITRVKRPSKAVQATYPQRAFMKPALDKEVAAGTIPNQWKNSIKRA